jgi:outer membrane protein
MASCQAVLFLKYLFDFFKQKDWQFSRYALVLKDVVSRAETIYSLDPVIIPFYEVSTMKTFPKLLLALVISALPALALAETPAADQKAPPAASAATIPPTPPESPLKAAEPPRQQQVAPAPVVSTPAPNEPAKQGPPPTGTVTQPLPAQPGVTVTPPISAQPAVLIGEVDLFRVSSDSETGKAGQARLTEKKKKLQNQIENKRKQLDKFRADVEAKMPSLSQDQREAKSKEFRKKVEDFQKFSQKAETEMQELQQDLSRILYEKIQEASAIYAENNRLALVITKRDLLYRGANVVPMDVTDGVVKLINEQDKKSPVQGKKK